MTFIATFAQERLGEVHQVAIILIRLVELEHRELGDCAGSRSLVAEVAVDLEYLLHPADDEPLQVELGRDAQEELHVERVVMRREGPRRGAARDRCIIGVSTSR
jgi:hypothetical protein